MTPSQEQAIRRAIAHKREQGENDIVVLAPFVNDDTAVDGVPVYGSFVEWISDEDGSPFRPGEFLVLTREQWDAAAPAFARSMADELVRDIEASL